MCNNNKSLKHGYLSVILFFAAITIGIIAVSQFSLKITLLHVGTFFLMILSVSYYYCSKCPVRDMCNHWLFGKVSKILSKPRKEPYNAFDLVFGTLLPVMIVIALPQYWLIKIPLLFLIYWLLITVAIIEIYLYVCSHCQNYKCSLCRNKSKNIH